MNAVFIIYPAFFHLNFGQIASKLEVFPGSEFRVAYEEAIKYGGRVILGDRPVQVGLVFILRKTADIAQI